jgi:hypothetical protein
MTISATTFGIAPTTIVAEPKPSGENHDAHFLREPSDYAEVVRSK